MTVISAMKFNPGEGAIVADEQASNQIRKYDIAEKIHKIDSNGGIVLFGGAGTSDFLYEANKKIQFLVSKKKDGDINIEDIANIISHVMQHEKRQYINAILLSRYGMSEDDLQRGFKLTESGKVELDSNFKEHVINFLSSDGFDNFIRNNFLVLAYDSKKKEIEIYKIGTDLAVPVNVAGSYSCIGSGTDMADGEMYDFFENIPRDKRQSIEPLEGLATLLHATDKASRVNIGVGGTPLISVIRKSEVIIPSEQSSRLASEIVRGFKKGHLTHEFCREALDALVYHGADFQEINRKMWENAKDRDSLNLMLRGYKN